MSAPLVILGASGHGREVAYVLLAEGGAGTLGAPAGFLDDDPALSSRVVGGLPVLGTTALLLEREYRVVLGVGYPEMKRRMLSRYLDRVTDVATLVHTAAAIGGRVTLGRGCFVQAGCVLTVDVLVEDFVTINASATINHDCRLGRWSTISPGAHLGGNVTVGEGAFVGIGASIAQGVSIGAWSTVGAGAAVVEDVLPNSVVAGVPAKVLSMRDAGWQEK